MVTGLLLLRLFRSVLVASILPVSTPFTVCLLSGPILVVASVLGGVSAVLRGHTAPPAPLTGLATAAAVTTVVPEPRWLLGRLPLSLVRSVVPPWLLLAAVRVRSWWRSGDLLLGLSLCSLSCILHLHLVLPLCAVLDLMLLSCLLPLLACLSWCLHAIFPLV